MKKQKKQLLLMIVLLLLLVAGYFGVQKYNEVQANKAAEDSSTYAIELDSSDVTELSYTYNGVEYAFVFEEDTWKYRDDKELNIMQSRLNTMAGSVAKLAVEDQIDNVTDMSLYGLDEPQMQISFVAGGTTYKIALGDYNSMSGLDYINIDDSSVVYTVETTLGDTFAYTLEDLIEEVEEEVSDEDAGDEVSDTDAGAEAESEAEAESAAGETAEAGSEGDAVAESEAESGENTVTE